MNRRVYFDHHFGMHSAFWEIVRYPPDGYQYVLPEAAWDKVFDRMVIRNDFIFANFILAKVVGKIVAPRLLKAQMDRFFKKPPFGTDLVFALDHPSLWRMPWVIVVGWPQMLTGMDPANVKRYRKGIERQFASEYCRRVITWCELGKKAIELNFDCSRFADKIEVVPLAIHGQQFTKTFDDHRVRILFVGTVNAPRGFVSRRLGTAQFFEFDGKGGRETLEAFRVLRQRYPNLELVMRASIPPEVKERYHGQPGIRFIDRIIPRAELDDEFMAADIFIYPTKQMTPWTVFLEAMSFELPIIATDVYANRELIQDGTTGLLVKGSSVMQYYWKNLLPSFGSPLHDQYMEGMKTVDPVVVKDLVDKTGLLIENKEVRRKMGRAARAEIEAGKHSIARRNSLLKRIFDDAVAV